MPVNPCPCPWFRIDNGNAFGVGIGTGATFAAAETAAKTASQANVVAQVNALAQPHSCAAGCRLVGRVTWPMAPTASFIMGLVPDGAGGFQFTVFHFGKFKAELRCKRFAAGIGEAMDEFAPGQVPWEFRERE